MTTLNFGKHKNKALADVARDHPDYLQWIVVQDFFKEYRIYNEVKALVDAMPAGSSSAASGSSTASSSAASSSGPGLVTVIGDCKPVPWGKYKGRPLADMLADVPYCKWVLGQPWFRQKDIYQRVAEAVGVDAPAGPSMLGAASTGAFTEPVRFGRYKDKLSKELLADVEYCRSLLSLQWFVGKHALYPAVKGVVERAGLPIPEVKADSGSTGSGPLPAGSVGFGKYRGEPEEKLLADVGYCRWLISTADFQSKHAELYPKVKAVVDAAPVQPTFTLQGMKSAAASSGPAPAVWAPSATVDSSWATEEQYVSSDDEH